MMPPVKKSTNKKQSGRKVLYESCTTSVCEGKKAITVEQAKKLLGWQEESDGISLGDDYIPELLSLFGKKVRLTNNIRNRQIYTSSITMLAAVVLQGWWKLNGEPIIVGKTGILLNGQHSLIGLIYAAHLYAEEPDEYPKCSDEPTIDKTVVFGIDESDDVVNTMDTCKPRSLNDVLYRSEFFSDFSDKNRKTVARMLNFAIMLLWERTGAKRDAHSPVRSHAESLDFLERHPRLLKAVRHIFDQRGDEKTGLAAYISLGYAAAMLYLMGCSKSVREKYLKDRNEKHLDWEHWEAACEFWEEFVADSKDLSVVHDYFSELFSSGSVGKDERCAVFAKAWIPFSSGNEITDLTLDFEEDLDDNGNLLGRTLTECPSVGGIDIATYDDEGDEDDATEITEEEVEKAKKEIREERLATEKKNKPSERSLPPAEHQKLPQGWKEGDVVWVEEEDGGHWRGKVHIIVGKIAEVRVAQGFAGAGTIQKVKASQLSKKQPRPLSA